MKTGKMLYRLLVLACLLQCILSYQMYQELIPNGANVPSPCGNNKIWRGVGHLISEGSGDKNPFGRDFADCNHNWTCVCPKDSDGDGRSNGVELGDPECLFINKTSTPPSTVNITHPGICDPVRSDACKKRPVGSQKYKTQQEWMDDECAKSADFDCEALHEEDVKTLAIRLPPDTSVPAKPTTYECQIFDLRTLGIDKDIDYHIVAVTPIIDNRNVLHHMVLSGCSDQTLPSNGPYDCGMVADETCMEFLHVWTVGISGECYYPNTGMRIGKTGSKIIAIQLHWNNPQSRTDFKDSSGLQIYYTPKLRQYDAGILTVGSTQFYLPPKREEILVHGTCPGGCTSKMLTNSINITSAWNHMHYAGKDMSIEVVRGGQHQIYLTQDKTYSYESPQVYKYQKPYILYPDDGIYTTCGFQTMDRNKTTFYGEGTFDEMCFGFISFYPKQNAPQPFCVDQMGVSRCSNESWGACDDPFKFYREIGNTEVFKAVSENCHVFAPCLSECVDTIVKYRRTEPCLQGKLWEFEEFVIGGDDNYNSTDFMSRLASCKVEVYQVLNPPTESLNVDNGNNFAKSTAEISFILLVIGFVAIHM